MTIRNDPPEAARLQRILDHLGHDPDNLHLQAEVCDLALQAGDLALAGRLLDHARRLAADAPAWRHRDALHAMACGRYAQADAMLAALQASGVHDDTVRFNRACCAYFQHEFRSACEILTPMHGQMQALPLLLRCLHRLGEVGQGMQLFERSLAQASPPAAAYGIASLIAVDADRMALAREWAEHALQREPRQHEALVARASVALSMQDADGASRDLRLAIACCGGDGRIHAAIGTACLLRHQPDAACLHFGEAVTRLPGHIGSWHGLGWSQLLIGEFDASLQSFERALDLDRNFAQSHGALAVAHAMRGFAPQARDWLARAQRLEPGNVAARYAQAILSGVIHDRAAFAAFVRGVCGDLMLADGRLLRDIVARPC